QVVGDSTTAGNLAQHAFRTAAGGTIDAASDLGTLGGPTSVGKGINDSGQVVGASYLAGGFAHAFRTTAAGKIDAASDLGTLGGTVSGAYAINASGQTVGSAAIPGDAVSHAFLANATGPMVDLNTLIPADSGYVLDGAEGINDAG